MPRRNRDQNQTAITVRTATRRHSRLRRTRSRFIETVVVLDRSMGCPFRRRCDRLPLSVAKLRVALPPYRGPMVCPLCGLWAGNLNGTVTPGAPYGFPDVPGLCAPCAHSLRPSGPPWIAGDLTVRSAFQHEGPLRRALHALKYQGVDTVAAPLALWLGALLPADATALVPIPRALARRLRYGADPGRSLAAAVGRRTGLPVVDVLSVPWTSPSQVRRRRAGPAIKCRWRVPAGSVLIDDVMTTGATLLAAHRATSGRAEQAVTVTRGGSFGSIA